MKKQAKVFVGVAVIIVAMGALLFLSLSRSSMYYMTVAEILSKPASSDQQLRVSGKIIGSSVSFDPKAVVLKFDITDGKQSLPVEYHGIKPNNFEDGNEAIIEGRYTQGGAFQAEKLMTKCPSKYEAK